MELISCAVTEPDASPLRNPSCLPNLLTKS